MLLLTPYYYIIMEKMKWELKKMQLKDPKKWKPSVEKMTAIVDNDIYNKKRTKAINKATDFSLAKLKTMKKFKKKSM